MKNRGHTVTPKKPEVDVSPEQFARKQGCSRSLVVKMIQSGKISGPAVSTRGWIYPTEARRQLRKLGLGASSTAAATAATFRVRAGGRRAETFADAKTRAQIAAANRAEREEMIAAGKYLPVEDLRELGVLIGELFLQADEKRREDMVVAIRAAETVGGGVRAALKASLDMRADFAREIEAAVAKMAPSPKSKTP